MPPGKLPHRADVTGMKRKRGPPPALRNSPPPLTLSRSLAFFIAGIAAAPSRWYDVILGPRIKTYDRRDR